MPDWQRKLEVSDLEHTFDRNRLEFYKYFEASVRFEGFRRFHVSLAGGNCIEDSPGTGLSLHNVQLEVAGANTVTRSGYYPTSDHGIVRIKPEYHGVSLTPDSFLLLHINATLNITGNLGTPVGGGVYVSHSGLNTSCLVPSTLYSESCVKLCFFQLVNSLGGFVDRESISLHNATVLVQGNDADSAIGKDVSTVTCQLAQCGPRVDLPPWMNCKRNSPWLPPVEHSLSFPLSLTAYVSAWASWWSKTTVPLKSGRS